MSSVGVSRGLFAERNGLKNPRPYNFATNTEGRYSYSLSTVWDMNFRHLEGNERGLLDLLAFLDTDGIPSQKPELASLRSRLKLIQYRKKNATELTC
jgi:hypothetical protein